MTTRSGVARSVGRVRVLLQPVPGSVLASWVAARLVVLSSLALALYLHRQSEIPPGGNAAFPHVGLLGWDAAFYRDIAEKGYAGLPVEARRFFPLLPLLVRILGLGTSAGIVLLVVVNVLAIAYAIALVQLVRVEGWDDELGSRSVWLLALAPPAFTLVMGYTEALAGLLAVLMFLGLRTRRWPLAMAAGLLAGLCRPTALLLCVPALIEALRAPTESWFRRAAAVVSPAVGTALYLGYIGARFGDPLVPLRIQQESRLHGPAANPIETILQSGRGLVDGHVGTGLHVPWLAVLIVLLVLMARRLPLSYTAWSACTLLGATVGTNLDSLERYAWSAFPFILAAAWILRGRPTVWQVVLTVSGALMATYSLLAFLGLSVP
jgi:hypothetical protein